jgi:hypothetical protein
MKKMDTQFWTQTKQRETMPRNPKMPTRTASKKKILQVITENFMEMLLDMVNQSIQEALKKFQDTKNKEYTETNE